MMKLEKYRFDVIKQKNRSEQFKCNETCIVHVTNKRPAISLRSLSRDDLSGPSLQSGNAYLTLNNICEVSETTRQYCTTGETVIEQNLSSERPRWEMDMGTADEQMLLKTDKVHIPWPMGH